MVDPMTAPEISPQLAPDDLDDAGIRTVIVTSADVTGRPVGKRFPVNVFRRLQEEGVPLSSCVLGWDIDQWPGPAQAYTGHRTGWHDVRLVPDLDTLRRAAWLEATAICVADFVEMGRDELVEVAPRTVLRRQVERFDTDELTPQVASELEFSLYRGSYDDGRTNGYESLVPTTLARADYTVQAGDRYEGFFARVRDALVESNLDPWTSQVEWGLGQWEINLEYRRALEMADRHMLFKLAMRSLADAGGLAATFMAKPFADTTGSSCHLHLSLVDGDGSNVFGQGSSGTTLAPPLRGAIGGVLSHAPELMLWYAPTINSYRRASGEEFSGHGISWATTAGWSPAACSSRSPHRPASSGASPAPTWTRTSRSRACSPPHATESRPAPTPASRSSETTGNANCRHCRRRWATRSPRSAAAPGRRTCSAPS
jgi:glutamine synthetase